MREASLASASNTLTSRGQTCTCVGFELICYSLYAFVLLDFSHILIYSYTFIIYHIFFRFDSYLCLNYTLRNAIKKGSNVPC